MKALALIECDNDHIEAPGTSKIELRYCKYSRLEAEPKFHLVVLKAKKIRVLLFVC
ncbi:hypothetical protein M3J09_005633 [Ascochyta lentis]